MVHIKAQQRPYMLHEFFTDEGDASPAIFNPGALREADASLYF
ncbi:hypothetical protein [Paraburkholderia sp.]|jgi:hypothetical protein